MGFFVFLKSIIFRCVNVEIFLRNMKWKKKIVEWIVKIYVVYTLKGEVYKYVDIWGVRNNGYFWKEGCWEGRLFIFYFEFFYVVL